MEILRLQDRDEYACLTHLCHLNAFTDDRSRANQDVASLQLAIRGASPSAPRWSPPASGAKTMSDL